jgi:hypothetical protein
MQKRNSYHEIVEEMRRHERIADTNTPKIADRRKAVG